MIVPMKRLFLLCVADEAERTLEKLRDLDVAHLDLAAAEGAATGTAKERLEQAERAVRIAQKAKRERAGADAAGASLAVDDVLALDARREALKGETETLRATIRRYAPFGDFDPALAKRLEAAGVKLLLRDDGSYEFLYEAPHAADAGETGVSPIQGQEASMPTGKMPVVPGSGTGKTGVPPVQGQEASMPTGKMPVVPGGDTGRTGVPPVQGQEASMPTGKMPVAPGGDTGRTGVPPVQGQEASMPTGKMPVVPGGDAGRTGVPPVHAARSLPLPTERLSATQGRLAAAEREIAALTAQIAATDVDAIIGSVPGLRDAVAFAAAQDEMAANRFGDGAASGADAPQISLVRGWIPADGAAALRAAAKANGWGVALRDPNPDETPPTLIRPPKLFRPVTALFGGLGIAPAYREADVSVPFMCYFSLFFAMLVGDGGYGAIILALTLWGWRKYRTLAAANGQDARCPGARGDGGRAATRPSPVLKSWLVLLTVFSAATVVWGLLSNTWFGAGLPFAAEWPTVKWLGDPTYNNMMLLCFTIGVSHLMLARIWTGLCMLNDRTCLAQFGWAGIVLFMYLVTNSIVGIFSGIPEWAYWMFGVSLVAVFGFTLKGSELKSRGIELGMLPLNIMSALGDIISYVRLFAVGLASVKVAQNFNDMALGLDLPLWLKIVPMVLILLVGHGLNFAMAGLSILVHAVRLNTLEFSNHKGISWAGYAFRPFRKTA